MSRIGKPRLEKSSTIASVPSVEPESTTMISASPSRLDRHLPMHASSFLQMTVAEIGRSAGEGEAGFGFARSVMTLG